jgi:hypothetical protein
LHNLKNEIAKKNVPISLEQEILNCSRTAISKTIQNVLESHQSPLFKLVTEVISSHNPELRQIINSAFESVIKSDDFKQSILSAFSHKISRLLISNNDKLLETVTNELQKDATFRAKLALAMSNVVETFKERKSKHVD